jgi:hypothetical protein
MKQLTLRIGILSLLLTGLTVLPAAAGPDIPLGIDYWHTPANGATVFEFPAGDVESLCNQAEDSAWNHKVSLSGVATAGSDWDTAVSRLDDVNFDSAGNGSTRIRVKALNLTNLVLHETPCGKLRWVVNLACCPQPITRMKLVRNTEKGGSFLADLTVSVEMKAYADNGAYVGSLFYTRELPDQSSGTPWSLGSAGEFRAGMAENKSCVPALRKKLSQYAPESSHYYWISNLIAKGECHWPK